jgi:hypothetical protein
VFAVVLLSIGPPAQATDATWVGGDPDPGVYGWYLGTNWSTAPNIPDGVGDAARFNNLNLTDGALTVQTGDNDITLGVLEFVGDQYLNDVTIADTGSSPNTLTFDNSGSGAELNFDLSDPFYRGSDTPIKVIIDPAIVLNDDLTLDMGGKDLYTNRQLDLNGTITDTGSHTLTVDGMTYAERPFNNRGAQWMVDEDITVGALDVAGGRFVTNIGTLNVTADTTISGGELYVGSGNTLNLTGTLDVSAGRINVYGTLKVNDSSLTVSGGTWNQSGDIDWTAAGGSGTMSVTNGGNLSFVHIQQDGDGSVASNTGAAYITNITVDGTSTLSGDTAFLTGRTVGTNLTLSNGAMLAHYARGAPDLSKTGYEGVIGPSNTVDTGLKLLYGLNRNPINLYSDPDKRSADGWTIEVGSNEATWVGIGADTTCTMDGWQCPEPIHFGFPTTQDGDLHDTIRVDGDVEIRTTDPVRLAYNIHKAGRGVMLVGGKLESYGGNSASSSLNVTGPGCVILANANNDVKGTWKVDEGVLRVNLYKDDFTSGTMSTLGDAANDIELTSGGTLTFRAGTDQEPTSQTMAMPSTRTITVGSGGGRIYLSPLSNEWQTKSDLSPHNTYAFQSVIDNDGLWNEGIGPGDQGGSATYDPRGLEVLELAAGQLTGSGDLTVEGIGGSTLRLNGSNTGYSGNTTISGTGTTVHADASDSLGSSGNIVLQDNAIYLTEFAFSSTHFARVSGSGTFAIGSSPTGTIDMTGKDLFLHTTKPIGDDVTVTSVTPGINGHKFGGGGGFMTVSDDLSGDLTVKGPGITLLTGNNSFSNMDIQGGVGIGSANALGSANIDLKSQDRDDLTDSQEMMFGKDDTTDFDASNVSANVYLSGGSVGFLYDKTLSSLSEVGTYNNTSTTYWATNVQVLSLGATGDDGYTIDAGGVTIADTSDPVSLVKKGNSVLDLTSNTAGNTYTEATAIVSGELKISQANQINSDTSPATELFVYDAQLTDSGQTVGPGKLHATDDMTLNLYFFKYGGGGYTVAPGDEAEVEVDAGKTVAVNGWLSPRVITGQDVAGGDRLRKTGDGTLYLTTYENKSDSNNWGLALEDGLTRVSWMPHAADSGSTGGNGSIFFEGGDLLVIAPYQGYDVLPPGNSDDTFGFCGMRVKDGTTSTLTIDDGAQFKLASPLNNPNNKWFGKLIIERGNIDGTKSMAEAIFGGRTTGEDWSLDSDGTLELKGGKLSMYMAGGNRRLPDHEDFTLQLSGGIANIVGGNNLLGNFEVKNAVEVQALSVTGGSGDITWDATADVTVSGSMGLARTSDSTTSVGAGASVTIDSGATLNVANANGVDPLSDGTNAVAVENNSTSSFNVNQGTVVVDSLTGVGRTNVAHDTLADPAEVPAELQIAQQGSAWANDNAQNTLNLFDDTTADDGYNPDTLAGTLDLKNNKIVLAECVNPGVTTTVEDRVLALVISGRNGGTWDGLGILSSDAGGDYAVGVTDQGVTGVKVAWTLGGDSNVDGYVDVSDLSLMGANYGTASGATWDMADSNYDGAVDVSDLSILGANYNKNIFGSTSVPEPATLGLLALGGLGVLVRRRRK